MRSTERDRELELDLDIEYREDEGEEVDGAGAFQDLLADRRKLITGALVVVLLVVGIYFVFPKLVGLDQAVNADHYRRNPSARPPAPESER